MSFYFNLSQAYILTILCYNSFLVYSLSFSIFFIYASNRVIYDVKN
jgi:hypothetical protein